MDESQVILTITLKALNDADFDEEKLEKLTQNLLREMRQMDEVERADRVLDPEPPEGNRSLGGFLIGILKAEVSVANFKKLMEFLGDRLAGKPIKIKVKKANGEEIEIEASSQVKFNFAMQKAQEFLKNT